MTDFNSADLARRRALIKASDGGSRWMRAHAEYPLALDQIERQAKEIERLTRLSEGCMASQREAIGNLNDHLADCGHREVERLRAALEEISTWSSIEDPSTIARAALEPVE